jgi:hypothetical protein
MLTRTPNDRPPRSGHLRRSPALRRLGERAVRTAGVQHSSMLVDLRKHNIPPFLLAPDATVRRFAMARPSHQRHAHILRYTVGQRSATSSTPAEEGIAQCPGCVSNASRIHSQTALRDRGSHDGLAPTSSLARRVDRIWRGGSRRAEGVGCGLRSAQQWTTNCAFPLTGKPRRPYL